MNRLINLVICCANKIINIFVAIFWVVIEAYNKVEINIIKDRTFLKMNYKRCTIYKRIQYSIIVVVYLKWSVGGLFYECGNIYIYSLFYEDMMIVNSER